MMTEVEYLLLCLAEECNEVAQRVSKALRFTLDEVQPGQEDTNSIRISKELVDLQVVVQKLVDNGIIKSPHNIDFYPHACEKEKKIEKFMAYSREVGTLI